MKTYEASGRGNLTEMKHHLERYYGIITFGEKIEGNKFTFKFETGVISDLKKFVLGIRSRLSYIKFNAYLASLMQNVDTLKTPPEMIS